MAEKTLNILKVDGRLTRAARRRLPQTLFYVAAFLYLFSYCMLLGAWTAKVVIPLNGMIQMYMRNLVLVLILFKLLIEGHTPREWLAFFALLFVAHVNMQFSGENHLFWTLLLVIGCKGIEMRRFAKVMLVPVILTTVIVISLNMLGLSEGVTGVRASTGRIRPSLGFRNPNNLGSMCFLICSLLGVLWWRRRPNLHLAVSVLLFIPMWVVAGCRSALIATLLACLIVQVFARREDLGASQRSQTIIAVLCLAVLVACIASSFVCAFVLDTPTGLLARIDYYLSYRISLSQAYYDLYYPSLIGQNILTFPKVHVEVGEGYIQGFTQSFPVDNGYLRLLMHEGIVMYTVYFGSLLALLVKAIRERHVNACLLFMCVGLIYGLVEWQPLLLMSNVFIIAMGTLYHRAPLAVLDMPQERPTEEAPRKAGKHFAR